MQKLKLTIKAKVDVSADALAQSTLLAQHSKSLL